MAPGTDTFDLGRLRLSSGEGRRIELGVALGEFDFGHEHYATEPALVPVQLDISRMTGSGYALRLRFEAALAGPCMRCLEPGRPVGARRLRARAARAGAVPGGLRRALPRGRRHPQRGSRPPPRGCPGPALG